MGKKTTRPKRTTKKTTGRPARESTPAENAGPAAEDPARPPAASAPTRVAFVPPVVKQVTLEVPRGQHSVGYNPRHIQIHISDPVARSVGHLFDGLRLTRATLANGQPIKSHQDAVRWLLTRMAIDFEAAANGVS